MKSTVHWVLLIVCLCGAGGCNRDDSHAVDSTSEIEKGGSMYPMSTDAIAASPAFIGREAMAIRGFRDCQLHDAGEMPPDRIDDIRYFADRIKIDHEEGVI